MCVCHCLSLSLSIYLSSPEENCVLFRKNGIAWEYPGNVKFREVLYHQYYGTTDHDLDSTSNNKQIMKGWEKKKKKQAMDQIIEKSYAKGYQFLLYDEGNHWYRELKDDDDDIDRGSKNNQLRTNVEKAMIYFKRRIEKATVAATVAATTTSNLNDNNKRTTTNDNNHTHSNTNHNINKKKHQHQHQHQHQMDSMSSCFEQGIFNICSNGNSKIYQQQQQQQQQNHTHLQHQHSLQQGNDYTMIPTTTTTPTFMNTDDNQITMDIDNNIINNNGSTTTITTSSPTATNFNDHRIMMDTDNNWENNILNTINEDYDNAILCDDSLLNFTTDDLPFL